MNGMIKCPINSGCAGRLIEKGNTYMKYNSLLIAVLFVLGSFANAIAAPTVAGNTIALPDDGWYQVQDAETFQSLCEGKRSCTVPAGAYIVINHSTGERFENVVVSDEPDDPGATDVRVTGNVIELPDNGWYQVQDADTFRSLCEGGRSCTVPAGTYIVINHSTGERFENVLVGEAPGNPGGDTVTVSGNVISMPDDGWYQVQNAETFQSLCEGKRTCAVAAGTYTVINHSTGERFENIVVEDDAPPVNPPDPQQPTEPVLVPVSVSGADTSGNSNDSPTATESASLRGPFLRDPTRGAGPPSVPTGLTLLLQSDNWLKFTWAPSTDDQSVQAYEVYRDGVLISTVRGDTGYEHDYRRWLSTSIIDCNYTRYANCSGENQPVPGNSYAYSVAAVDNEGMRSARSSEVVYTFPANRKSAVDLTNYAQVFHEEFDGPALDRSRWKTSLPWGPDRIINGELQYFANVFGADPIDHNPFVFTGDSLQITGTVTPLELLAAANNQPYLSGVISTSDYFEMTYGYVEMNARLASGQGLLSTFYLFNQDYYKNKPEIDIVEYIGSRPDKSYQTYHYYDSNRVRSSLGEKHSSPTMEAVSGIDLSADFHRYSVLWEPGLIVWYIDGVEIHRITGVRVSDEPMNIVAHLVVGSNWIGAPDAQSVPAVFEIDYIKAWQRQ